MGAGALFVSPSERLGWIDSTPYYTVDNKHIFSEVEDPERQALLIEILNLLGKRFVMHCSYWVLFFRDVHQLRRDVDGIKKVIKRDKTVNPWFGFDWIGNPYSSVFGFSKPPHTVMISTLLCLRCEKFLIITVIEVSPILLDRDPHVAQLVTSNQQNVCVTHTTCITLVLLSLHDGIN